MNPTLHLRAEDRIRLVSGFHLEGIRRQDTTVRLIHVILLLGCLATAMTTLGAETNGSSGLPDTRSRLIEVAGKVELILAGETNWSKASVGSELKAGDRMRTLAQSRAALQLSDRSVIRLNELTTLQILPPRQTEKRRFALPKGSLFFFNREKPADVEFDTPLAAGAIRGTEFLLEVAADSQAVRLALIDGRVELRTPTQAIGMNPGEDLLLQTGRPPQRTVLVNAAGAIQWALYYPAVLLPEELGMNSAETATTAEAMRLYRLGDLVAALAVMQAPQAGDGASVRQMRASLLLSVGQVAEADNQLLGLPPSLSGVRALRELVAVVRGDPAKSPTSPTTAGEWLARSYTLQARADLPAARAAAVKAVELVPGSGFTQARLAELAFAFGDRKSALQALDHSIAASPRLAPAWALRGFVLLEQGSATEALQAFDRARELDAAFAQGWLGRGLVLMRLRRFSEARASFQAAAALEPQRGLFRAYLGKAASELGEAPAAEKEFRLARTLDAADPTAWSYSALHLWRENRFNEAIFQMEEAASRNDTRAPFRSQLLLDADRSVRSANLAALYRDAGLSDVSHHAAASAVAESYANFSGHLFLANSHQIREDVNRFDLRLETARQSEQLVANLLAPVGAGNLSQQLSQQEHLRFFDPRPIGVSSLTEYGGAGDWRQSASVFGTVGGLGYAVDANYTTSNGDQPNGESERHSYSLTLKQRLGFADDIYLHVGRNESVAGDVARHWDPAQSKVGFHVEETQEPVLHAGWHHQWSPGNHTLLLVSRLEDRLSLIDPQPNVLFLRYGFSGPTSVSTPPGFDLNFDSRVALTSAELQQVFESEKTSLVVGGRWQAGEVESHAILNRGLSGVVTDQQASTDLQRGNAYAYGSWRVLKSLRLIGGVSYDHVSFPENSDLAPVSAGEASRDLVSPKAGLLLTPWKGGLVRAAYSRSLGGLFFDNSIRLEPTQLGGFNQAFRSLIPESVAGIVPGTRFDSAGVGFDQSFRTGTWFGIEAGWLKSRGDRVVGLLTNGTLLPVPDSASGTRQQLEFRERSLSAYAAQLIGDSFSVSARYRLSEASLKTAFPEIPAGVAGLGNLLQDERALLHQVSLAVNFHHASGVFGQWESVWLRQEDSGYGSGLPDDELCQHNLTIGYRLPRRHAEVRLGVLNLLDSDYRLNPLNLLGKLPRERTFTASLRLNF